MKNFGYDISDFQGTHHLFGNMQHFEDLVGEVHKRDLKLILCFVPNHSSDEHARFVKSRSSRNNPRHDWYYWQVGNDQGGPPKTVMKSQ
jgi:alpha-glucosidase